MQVEFKKKRLFFPGSTIFKLHATNGLAVVDTLAHLKPKGIKVEWASFVTAALEGGWSGERIIETVASAQRDLSFDTSVIEGTTLRLKLVILNALDFQSDENK